MKILRSSMYHIDDLHHPITLVLLAPDVRRTLEEVAAEMKSTAPGAFVVTDIFEADADNFIHATALGHRRLADSARANDERNMAISFYWNTTHLRIVSDRGQLVNPAPAPLCVEQVSEVWRQVMMHPAYKHQRLVCQSQDGKLVVGCDGAIVSEP